MFSWHAIWDETFTGMSVMGGILTMGYVDSFENEFLDKY
jgi:hypothetical protein